MAPEKSRAMLAGKEVRFNPEIRFGAFAVSDRLILAGSAHVVLPRRQKAAKTFVHRLFPSFCPRRQGRRLGPAKDAPPAPRLFLRLQRVDLTDRSQRHRILYPRRGVFFRRNPCPFTYRVENLRPTPSRACWRNRKIARMPSAICLKVSAANSSAGI